MKFKMAPNSVFAILLRSPWWVSLLVAAGFVLLAQVLLPPQYRAVGSLVGLPFLVITGIAFWRQWNLPSAKRVEETLAAASAMPWKDFATLLEAGFARDGNAVTRLPGPVVDFQLVKGGRTALVCARRWKASNHGAEPLRELQAAVRAQDASEAIYVALQPVSDQARALMAQGGLNLLDGPALARLLKGMPLAGQQKN